MFVQVSLRGLCAARPTTAHAEARMSYVFADQTAMRKSAQRFRVEVR